MSNKCKLIGIGKINKYILLIISASLFKIGLWLFKPYFFYKNEIIHLSDIPQIIFYSLGLSLSFPLYLIYKKCNKSQKNNYLIDKSSIYSILFSKRVKKVSQLKKFLWILFISVIDFISILLRSLVAISTLYDISSWILNFIFMCLYFYFIFKIKLYKHHILCIIWFFLMGIFFNIIAYGSTSQDNDFIREESFLKYALNFLSVTLYCLIFFTYKLLIQETYLKPYEILYIQGLIELLLSSILIAILINCKVIYNGKNTRKRFN